MNHNKISEIKSVSCSFGELKKSSHDEYITEHIYI